MTADLFESYLIALDALLARLGRDHALTADALLYQQRLQENIERTRRYGDNENRRSERSEISEPLNRLCRDALGVDFNTLMRQAQAKLAQDDGRLQPRTPFEPETVLIRGGSFLMGSDAPAVPAWEWLQHSVALSTVGPWALSLRAPIWVPADYPLVGRTAELQRLDRVWQNALVGQAHATVVCGVAGSGKTRLVQESITRHNSDQAGVLSAQSLPGVQAPYQAINDALKPVIEQNLIPGLPDEAIVELRRLDSRAIPEAMPTEAQQRREWALTLAFEALSRRAPVVLFIDDLQWTDPTSLGFIRCLMIRKRQMRLLFIGTLRTDDPEVESSGVASLRDQFHRAGLLTEVELKPLSKESSHELLCAWLGLADASQFHDKLFASTEGNPYFLLETLQTLSDQGVIYLDADGVPSTDYDEIGYQTLPVPDTVQQAIRLRLNGLNASAQAFLDAAAIVGRQFDPALVQQVAGLSDDESISALEEISKRKFVRKARSLCDFSNGMIRETLIGALNPLKRSFLHRRVFAALKQTLKPAPSLAVIQQLAQYADNGGLWPEAFRYSLQAGLRSWGLFDAQTACRSLERAQEISQDHRLEVENQDRLNLLDGLGDVYANLGKRDEARSQYEEAMQLVQGQKRLSARLGLKMAITYQNQAQFDDAVLWLDRAHALLQEDMDDALCSQVYIQYGVIDVMRGNLDDALIWAQRAGGMESAQYHNLMAVVQRGRDSLGESLAHCDQAIALAQKPNNLLDLAKAHTNRGAVLSQMNRWQEAKQAHEQALKVLSTTRDMRMYAATHCNLSDVCRHLGDLEAALRLAEESLKLAVALDLHFEEALAHLNLGEALLESGQPRQARTEHLEKAQRMLDERRITYLRPEVERGVAETLLQEGELEQAERSARKAITQAEAQQSGSDEGIGLRVLAAIQRAQGLVSDAEGTLQRGIELLRLSGPKFELAQADLEMARLVLGDPARQEQAGLVLKEARSIFEEAGAQLALKAVDALEAQLAASRGNQRS